MQTVKVQTTHKYKVVISSGLICHAGSLIQSKLYSMKDTRKIKAFVVFNEDLKKYTSSLLESLYKVGFDVYELEVPVGEATKDYRTIITIIDKLTAIDFSREDVIISFGGGSIGDAVGFVASIYMRGTKLVHIPTTLLAMVDSSVGGKTAFNYKKYKNLIGTFYQPDLVIEDTDMLATIEGKNLCSGMGEIIKYGVINPEIFKRLSLKIGVDNVEDLIYNCVKVKAELVEKDEYDEGIRHVLNLGHTIGHAMESLSDFHIPHGIAVACGIMCIARCQDEAYDLHTADKIKSVLDIQGIPVSIPYKAEEILCFVNKDKKWKYGKLNLVLFDDIGKCRIQAFTPEELQTFIKGGLNAR